MPHHKTVLVTGGAGFVGSHCVAELISRGCNVVVFDNLQQGHRAAVPAEAEFIEGDLASHAALARLFSAFRFDAILHFASNSLVGKSMRDPHLYLHDNVVNALNRCRPRQTTGSPSSSCHPPPTCSACPTACLSTRTPRSIRVVHMASPSS